MPLARKRIVDAVRPPHHEQTVGHIVRCPGGVFLELGVQIKRADIDGDGLVFR